MSNSRTLTLGLLTTLWLAPAVARAQTPPPGDVAGAPLVVVFTAEGSSEARARATFERGLVAALSEARPVRRAIRLAPGQDCAGAPSCYREAARAQRAQEYIVARWEDEGGRVLAEVSRHLAGGEQVAAAHRRGPALDPALLSHELILETFSPELFVGYLELHARPGEVTQVWLDGVPLREGEWSAPLEVIAGPHRVDGLRGDGSTLYHEVDVPFGKTVPLALVVGAPTSPAAARHEPPAWALWSAGTISAVALVASAALLGDAALAASALDQEVAARSDALSPHTGESAAHYSARIATAMTLQPLTHVRASVHTGLRSGVAALSIGIVSGVVTGILWAAREVVRGPPTAE